MYVCVFLFNSIFLSSIVWHMHLMPFFMEVYRCLSISITDLSPLSPPYFPSHSASHPRPGPSHLCSMVPRISPWLSNLFPHYKFVWAVFYIWWTVFLKCYLPMKPRDRQLVGSSVCCCHNFESEYFFFRIPNKSPSPITFPFFQPSSNSKNASNTHFF